MIKVAFVDFWGTFDAETFKITEYLREIDEVKITDLKYADYVFYGVHGNQHWFAPDHSIKIFFTIENVTPDFNACDYALGFDWIHYEDRYMRLPLYYLYPQVCELMESKHLQDYAQVAALKKRFCSMTVTNDHRHPIFKTLFEALSNYQQVDSGGMWNNNVGGRVSDKLLFDRQHKFSIVCENSAHIGYTTEKIVQSFAANCIPIYWGDPAVTRVFNPKAFIRVQDFPSVQDVVDRVIQIDHDEILYKEMLSQPALVDVKYTKDKQIELLKEFLANIFRHSLKCAYRRNRFVWGDMYIEEHRRQVSNPVYVAQKKYHDWVWKIKQSFKLYRVDKGRQQTFPAIPTSNK